MRRTFPEEHKPWLKDIFAGVDDAIIRRLQDAGRASELVEGEKLAGIHGSIVRVEEGMCKVAVTAENRSLTVGLYGPNDTICAPLYHEWEEGLYYIAGQEETRVRVIPREAVLEAMGKSPV